MPPPLSPQQQQQQQQQHSHASQVQRALYSSAFGGRELPGLGHVHRPGSSMSISSLIGGGDTSGAPTQTSQSQPSPHTNVPSSNSHSMQPPSPRRGFSSAPRSDLQPFRRQPSPDRHMYASNNALRAPEGHSYGAASPSHPYSIHGSPDQGRLPLGQTSQPYKPMIFQGQGSYATMPNDAYAREARPPPANIPPRPNSQPMGPGQSHPDSATYVASGPRRTQYGPPEERRRTLGESHHARPNVAELVGGVLQASDRDRPSTVQPISHSTFSPPRNPWRQPMPEEPPQESAENRREEPSSLYRGYEGYSAPSQGPAPYGPHGPEDMVRGRSLDHLSHRAVEQYHAGPTSDPNSIERQKSEQLSRSYSSGGSGYPGRALYDQARRMGEDMHHAKALLAFGPDMNRKTGRASPLPQAVQGAQAQPLSLGKDPHVKSEFGRMFSGLGGLGSSTPSRGSPMPLGAHDAIPPGTDLNEHLRLARVISQNGRKPKRVKDEDGSFDQDDADERSPPFGARGAKRNKHAHPGHHHHHHAHQ
jgi:hypothetical protein